MSQQLRNNLASNEFTPGFRFQNDGLGNIVLNPAVMYDPVGSMSLKAPYQEASYHLPCLNNKWSDYIQQEPRDFIIERDAHPKVPGGWGTRSAYKRLMGSATTNKKLGIPETLESQQKTLQLRNNRKENLRSINANKRMINSISEQNFVRYPINESKPGAFPAVLPRWHNARKFSQNFDTTYEQSYIKPPQISLHEDGRELSSLADIEAFLPTNQAADDLSIAWRRMKSQFTDNRGHKVSERETFINESGNYLNSNIRKELLGTLVCNPLLPSTHRRNIEEKMKSVKVNEQLVIPYDFAHSLTVN